MNRHPKDGTYPECRPVSRRDLDEMPYLCR